MTSGYYHLILEILMLAHFDLKNRERKGGVNFQYRHDALTFIETEWFEMLCEAVNLDPSWIRKGLIQSTIYKE